MMDLLLQYAIGNLIIATPLALLAFVVHRSQRMPALAHLLWVLVLAKLVTPPLVTLPIMPFPVLDAAPGTAMTPAPFAALPEGVPAHASVDAGPAPASPSVAAASNSWMPAAKLAITWIWLAGSLFVLTRSIIPMLRFNRLLRRACRPAASDLQTLAATTAARLGLPSCPPVQTVAAHVAPLVWWMGGRIRIVLPEAIVHSMDDDELQMILAHELAHIRRRDHLVRWLEWLACVTFWWNPLAWWARRNLRLNEESCCDALVLRTLHAEPREYAGSLLTVVEFLASPALRPPAAACAMTSGGSLERRFKMIVSMQTMRTAPRWLSTGLLILTMAVLPFGLTYGQDVDAVERRLGAAVAEGELTASQAAAMMKALREVVARDDAAQRVSEIKAAVEAGIISKAEGTRAIEALHHEMKRDPRGPKVTDPEAPIRARMQEIEAAIKAGIISKAEGARAIEALHHEMKRDPRGPKVTDPEAPIRARMQEIEAAIKAGIISKAEGARAIEALHHEMKRDPRGPKVTDPEAPIRARMQEIEAAIKAGIISKAEGARAIEALHHEMKRDPRGPKTTDPEAPFREQMREIETAVKAGIISHAEGIRAIEAIQHKMKHPRDPKAADAKAPHKERMREIEAAIKAGIISHAEGLRAMEAIQREMKDAERVDPLLKTKPNARHGGVIRGFISDGDLDAPLAKVRVQLVGDNWIRQAVSDSQGRYVIDRIPAGTYTMLFTRDGYEQHFKAAVVEMGQAGALDVNLRANAMDMDDFVDDGPSVSD